MRAKRRNSAGINTTKDQKLLTAKDAKKIRKVRREILSSSLRTLRVFFASSAVKSFFAGESTPLVHELVSRLRYNYRLPQARRPHPGLRGRKSCLPTSLCPKWASPLLKG